MFVIALAALAAAPQWVPLDQAKPAKPKREEARPPAQPVVQPKAVVPEPLAIDAPQSPVVAPSPVNASARLDLTCFGGGTANKVKVTTVDTDASFSGLAGGDIFSGNGSATSTVYGTRQQGFGDQVDIRLFGGDDRIRMPRTMLPWLHGGDHGWFKLKDVVADARSIRASAAVNIINNPKVFIDRVTGTISISGKAGDYAGQCQAIDANAAPKF